MHRIHISRDRQNLGNFTLEEVQVGLKTGRFFQTDLGWKEGMSTWVPLSEMPELATAVSDTSRVVISGSLTHPGLGASLEVDAASVEPAWERREEVGLFPAIVETVKGVLSNPTRVFSAMPKVGGLGGPLLFMLILGWITFAVSTFYQAGIWLVNPESLGSEFEGFGTGIVLFVLIGYVVIGIPIFVVASAFVSAAITHLCLMLVGGAKAPFETTFRVLCYCFGATSVFMLVPMCGSIIYSVWYLVVTIIGLARAHNTDFARVIIAVFLPLILFCGCVIAGIVFFGGAFASEALMGLGEGASSSGE